MEKQQSEHVLQQEEKHQRNAADLLVECLQEEGVEYIFGIPGEENLAVMNAIDQSRSGLLPHAMSRGLRLWQMYMED